MLQPFPVQLLNPASDYRELEFDAGATAVIVHNSARHAVTATLRIESDAPCSLQVGDAERVECAAGSLIVCITIAAGRQLILSAGEEDVSVELHSIAALPG
jgi:hypothetical protein